MVLITQRELEEVKELLNYLDDVDKELIKKLISSYENLNRRVQENRKRKLMKKEERDE